MSADRGAEHWARIQQAAAEAAEVAELRLRVEVLKEKNMALAGEIIDLRNAVELRNDIIRRHAGDKYLPVDGPFLPISADTVQCRSGHCSSSDQEVVPCPCACHPWSTRPVEHCACGGNEDNTDHSSDCPKIAFRNLVTP